MLAVAACGGSDDNSSTPIDTPSTEIAPEATPEAPEGTVSAEPAAGDAPSDFGEDAGDGSEEASGCAAALTAEDIESIFGSTPEISGSGEQCQHVYASDAVGTFQAYSGSKADDAIGALLDGFASDETKSNNGVLLEDGRGYVLDGTFSRSAVVRGDSGQVFVFTAPDNLDVADIESAMQNLADLLLTR